MQFSSGFSALYYWSCFFQVKLIPQLAADILNDLVQEDIVPFRYIVADSLKGGRI